MAHELQLAMGLFTVFNAGYWFWSWAKHRFTVEPDRLGLFVAVISLTLGICTLGDYMSTLQMDKLMSAVEEMSQQSSNILGAGK